MDTLLLFALETSLCLAISFALIWLLRPLLTKAMFWHRTLQFPNKPLTEFRSRIEYLGGNEIIEYVRFGLGIRMRMSVQDGALVFTSAGYVWDIGKVRIPIPTWAILGDAKIIERAISEHAFYIHFTMVHPLFGETFGYSGIFSIVEQG